MKNKTFRGEVWNNIDSTVLEKIVSVNAEDVDGKVGNDSYTKQATEYLQSFFENEIAVLYTINGTAANIVALKALLDRFGTVICAEQAHINTYECGALEYNLGNKILTAPSFDAKLTPKMIDDVLKEHESHQYVPQVIAITQPTEMGTVYTVDEIKTLATYAHNKNMKLFVDGARLGAALASLDVSLRQMMEQTGVDVFTVGGTKAGAMFGEAVVFTNKADLPAGDYILKQSLQHFDKSKFLGAQMLALFENDRWIHNFNNANKMAKLLENELIKKGIEIVFPVESNVIFCVLDEETLSKMCEVYDLKYWYKDKKIVRIVTTFATTKEEIMKLAATVG